MMEIGKWYVTKKNEGHYGAIIFYERDSDDFHDKYSVVIGEGFVFTPHSKKKISYFPAGDGNWGRLSDMEERVCREATPEEVNKAKIEYILQTFF